LGGRAAMTLAHTLRTSRCGSVCIEVSVRVLSGLVTLWVFCNRNLGRLVPSTIVTSD
jgi:hypothetical protein